MSRRPSYCQGIGYHLVTVRDFDATHGTLVGCTRCKLLVRTRAPLESSSAPNHLGLYCEPLEREVAGRLGVLGLARACTGGPTLGRFCGSPATCVPIDPDGMEWFACAEHTGGRPTEPIAAWFLNCGLVRERTGEDAGP